MQRGGIGIVVTANMVLPESSFNMNAQDYIRRKTGVSNDQPFTLFGGMNVLESGELALEVARTYKSITEKLGIPMSSKHPLTKPTVPRLTSFRGPGLEKGCEILAEIRDLWSSCHFRHP